MEEKNQISSGLKITINGENVLKAIKKFEKRDLRFGRYQEHKEVYCKPGIRPRKNKNTSNKPKTYVKK